MNSERVLQLKAGHRPGLRLSCFVQLMLTTLGAAGLVARSILTTPVLAQIGLLLPPLLLAMWLMWRLTQHQGTVRSPLELPLLAAAATLTLSSLFGVADGSAVLSVLIHWAVSGMLLFLTVDLLALGWEPRVFVRGVLLTVSAVLLLASVNIGGWILHWVLLWQPGEPLLPVGYRVAVLGMHPNLVAMIINIGLPCAIIGLWSARENKQRVLWGGWLLLAVAVLFFSSSRGGWLAAAAIASVTLLPLIWSDYRAGRQQHMRVAVLLAGCYGAMFGLLFLSQQTEILAQHGGNLLSPVGRFTFWHRALLVFGEHPLIGVGPAGFNIRFNTTEVASVFFQPQHAHSLYLTVLSELGVLGAAILLTLVCATFVVWMRSWRGAPVLAPTAAPWTGRQLLLATGAVCVGMFVHGLVDTPSPLIAGLVLCMVATGLTQGNCWRLVTNDTQEGVASDRGRYASFLVARSSFSVRLAALRAPALHVVIVLVALLAWSSYTLVSRQIGRWQVLVTAADEALAQGYSGRADLLAAEAIARLPERGEAYSLRAIALAARARSDSSLLQEALAAEDAAVLHDPSNHAAPLNRAMLLAEMGRQSEAEDALRAFIAKDTAHWAVPSLLLAHLREQAGDTSGARALWQQTLEQQPDLYGTAACTHSTVCTTLAPPESAYGTLWKVQQQPAQSDPEILPSIVREASAWQSVDLWATGSIVAARMGDELAARRYLQAAEDQSQVIGSEPTVQLALAQLRYAMRRNDQQTAQTLLRQWLTPHDATFVPQISHLLTTETDVAFARVAVDAASWLGDSVALTQAQAYLRETQAVAVH